MVVATDLVRRNNVNIVGAGPRTLVLAHGLGCDQTVWQPLVERLARDHRLVLFDHVGAGRSDPAAYDPERYGSLDAYAADLIEVVRACGGPAPVLLAHSISGSLGIIASVAAPGLFARMVMLSPSPRFLDDPPDYRGGFQRRDVEELLALMDQNFMGWATATSQAVAPDARIAQQMLESFCANEPRALRAFAAVVFLSDVRALLPRVATPTLIMQCTDDTTVPREVGEAMHRALPGSEYRLVEVAGHFPQLSHPALVEEIVRDYLARGS